MKVVNERPYFYSSLTWKCLFQKVSQNIHSHNPETEARVSKRCVEHNPFRQSLVGGGIRRGIEHAKWGESSGRKKMSP